MKIKFEISRHFFLVRTFPKGHGPTYSPPHPIRVYFELFYYPIFDAKFIDIFV